MKLSTFLSWSSLLASTVVAAVALSGCDPRSAADIASENLSKASDNFEVVRRIVFFNGITDEYILEITGRCSKGNNDTATQVSITCRNPDGTTVKHMMGLSDNVSYLVQQMDGVNVSDFHTRVVFRPQTILPDIDFQGSGDELLHNRNTDG